MKYAPMTRHERRMQDPHEKDDLIREILALMKEMDVRQLQRFKWNAERIRR